MHLPALAKRIGEFNGVVEEAALREAGWRVRPRQPRYIRYSNFAGIKTVLGALGRVKPGAVLINVARRELVDRDALVAALDVGRLGGLGLDVLYREPADPSEPPLRYRGRNVILMPHTAVGSRANALHDVETLCVNLWRGIAQKRGA